mgnify:CR=1 FL=1
MKAFVIGDEDLVLSFKLIGIPGLFVSDANEALETLKRIISMEGAKIIFISENLSTPIVNELNAIRQKNSDFLIVEVPGKTEVKGELPSVQNLIQRILKIRV